MKPTPEDKQWLRDYLYEALSYRETFDEVYDHILLALQHELRQEFFESTVYKIIDEDFGGSINMLNMEVDCEDATRKEANAQYWQTFYSWVMFPKVFFILIVIGATSFIRIKSLMAALIMISIVILIGLVPLITVAIRKLTVRFVHHDKKKSIRDSAFKWLAYWYIIIGIVIINPLVQFIDFCLWHLFKYPSAVVYQQSLVKHLLNSFFFAVAIIHMLTLIELFRDEYKTKMIKAKH